VRLRLVLAIVLACCGSAWAAEEDVRERQVREELERELEAMMKVPPPSMEIFFDGMDAPRYELLEATFKLDDAPLPVKVGAAGKQSLFFGVLSPGKHTVTALLVYREKAGGLFSYANLKFKLPGRYHIEAQRGLHMRMRIKVEAYENLPPEKRLEMLASLEADMLVDASEGPSAVAATEPAAAPAAPVTPPATTARANPEPAATPTPAVESAKGGEQAEPRVASGSEEKGPAVATAEKKPKKKRVRRRLQNLLQNLARGNKEEAQESSDAEADADSDARLEALRKNLLKSGKGNEAGKWTVVEEVEEEEDAPEPAPLVPVAGGARKDLVPAAPPQPAVAPGADKPAASKAEASTEPSSSKSKPSRRKKGGKGKTAH